MLVDPLDRTLFADSFALHQGGGSGKIRRMRKIVLLFLLGLSLTAPARGQQRLDLRIGHGLEALPNPKLDGFRIYLDGRLLLHVASGENGGALLIDPAGGRRTIVLPEITPRQVEFNKNPPAASHAAPDFITKDFTTFYDGLSLLLDQDALRRLPPLQRFSARIESTTDPGKVGHGRFTVLTRGARLTDATLDRQLERFIQAGPLPPLAWGSAVCDLEILLFGKERPRLTVWLGRPFSHADPAAAPLSAGTLHQRPLGLPAAVATERGLAATLARYEQDRRASREALLRLIDQPGSPPVYGAWRLDASPARRAVAELLPRVPAGQSAPFLFLHAWTLAHDKRFAPAAATMRQAALLSDDPHLAAEARLLAACWSSPTETNQAQVGREHGTTDLALEIRLAEQAAIALTPINALPQLDAALVLLRRAAQDDTHTRFDQQWIQRALVRDAAGALAAAGDRDEPLRADRAFRQWLTANNPSAEWLLYDAGVHLCEKGRPQNAAVILRWLTEDYPFSKLAPEARRRLAGLLGPEPAAAMEKRLAEDLDPGSPWRQRWEREPPPVWLATVQARLDDPENIRLDAWRRLRDRALAESATDAANLLDAESASRQLTARAGDDAVSRADRLRHGDILLAAGNLLGARRIYASLADGEPDDALRHAALLALAATLRPDARRVARTLHDEQTGAYWELLVPVE